jgi:hypothetical protein
MNRTTPLTQSAGSHIVPREPARLRSASRPPPGDLRHDAYVALGAAIVALAAAGCGGSAAGEAAPPAGAKPQGNPGPVDAGAAGADARLSPDAATPDAGASPGSDASSAADVVLPCAQLPAGTWQNITPPGVDLTHGGGLLNVIVDPRSAGTVYATADQQGIYKSTDCGSTWAMIDTGANSAALNSGSPWVIALAPPEVVYAGSLYAMNGPSTMYKSVDDGVDWTDMFPPGSLVAQTVQYDFLQDIGIDPINPDHLVVTFHADCLAPDGGPSPYGTMCLGESRDAGATWRLFKGPLSSWGEAAEALVIGPQTFLYTTPENGIWYTADDGATWEMVGPGGTGNVYRARDGYYYLATLYGVHRSPDEHVWTYVQNTPNGVGIAGDGQRMFNIDNNGNYYVASESDGTTWTKLSSPVTATGARVANVASDVPHGILYSAATAAGLWLYVTQ